MIGNGTIKRLVADRGFGFIVQDKGPDLFFHHSAVDNGFENLNEGDVVEFEVDENADRPRAKRVRLGLGGWS